MTDLLGYKCLGFVCRNEGCERFQAYAFQGSTIRNREKMHRRVRSPDEHEPVIDLSHAGTMGGMLHAQETEGLLQILNQPKIGLNLARLNRNAKY